MAKKIIIVTDAWYPLLCGVTRIVDKFREEFEKKGHRVILIQPELFSNFPFPLYPEVHLAVGKGKQLEKIFENEKPDYVHIATEWTLGISARRLCKKKNIPFTTYYHTNFPLYINYYLKFGTRMSEFIAHSYMRWFHNGAKATLVSNKSIQEELQNNGYKNVVVSKFGVDTDLFKRGEPQITEGLEKPIFFYFGRICKEKSVEDFLKLKLPGTKLLVGDGPTRLEMEEKYPEAIFVGYKTGQNLVDYISIADVFVFPSRTETFGLVVLEALACGVPVAAYNAIGPKDTITHEVDGYLADDIKGLEKGALACLNLSREKCREKALQYSWDKAADSFLENMEKYR